MRAPSCAFPLPKWRMAALCPAVRRWGRPSPACLTRQKDETGQGKGQGARERRDRANNDCVSTLVIRCSGRVHPPLPSLRRCSLPSAAFLSLLAGRPPPFQLHFKFPSADIALCVASPLLLRDRRFLSARSCERVSECVRAREPSCPCVWRRRTAPW
jgi:hypothetical protein